MCTAFLNFLQTSSVSIKHLFDLHAEPRKKFSIDRPSRSAHSAGFYLHAVSEDFDLRMRSLGYEPTRILAHLSCSIIDLLLIPWFFLLFGRFCGRDVVGNQVGSLILRSLTRWHQAVEFFNPVEDEDHEKFVSSFAEVIIPQGSNPGRRFSRWRSPKSCGPAIFPVLY